MKTFLQHVADSLLRRYGHDLSRVIVVFPGKRASLFLDQALALSSPTPVWAPTYKTISDLFCDASPYALCDKVEGICRLYDAYARHVPSPQSLSQFYSWGEILLSDFDDIDKHLVDVQQLFANVRDLHALDDNSYITPEQEQALRSFFSNFSLQDNSALKERFLQLWEHLPAIYADLQSSMRAAGLLYEGALQRAVVEGLRGGGPSADAEGTAAAVPAAATAAAVPFPAAFPAEGTAAAFPTAAAVPAAPAVDPSAFAEGVALSTAAAASAVVPSAFAEGVTFAFVGFNVLNAVEQALFDELQRRGQALFFWDYDLFYAGGGKGAGAAAGAIPHHEAGHFLRQNLERYGNELPPDCFDNFRQPKDLTIITASSENAQARYLPQWLREHSAAGEGETLADARGTAAGPTAAAVVLCNEQLLQPVLHAIPDPSMPLNITMGFPFTDTPVHSFLLALTALQTDGYDAAARRFRRAQLRTVRAHPYTLRLTEDQWLRRAEGGVALLAYLQECLAAVARQLTDDLIAQEAIYIAFTRLTRLIDLMSGPAPLLRVTDVTLVHVLRSLLSTETIPFHGEPAVGLQVMGVLETRALDFRNILLLSVGEGFLPKKVGESSFIPYYLREAFGLTTVRHQIAVYAYYFYRLIQRAEHVTFVYNESNSGLRQNEISRFLRQLLAETDFPIRLRKLQADSAVEPLTPIVREKTPEVLRQLREYYDNAGRPATQRRFLSPSAMNAFTTCPLLFYYRYVEGLRVDPDPADGLDAILFGDVFHRAAELLYRQLTSAGAVVRGEDIDFFLEMDGQRLEPFVRQAFREKFFKGMPEEYRGILYIARRVVNTYLMQLLRHDRRLTPITILGLEVRQTKTLHIADMEIDTGGIIDRLDLVADDQVAGGQAIRVVDYKTGGRPEAVATLDQLFQDTDQKAHYAFQTILYAAIVAEARRQPVTPALFYVHRSGAETYSPKLRLCGQLIHDVGAPAGRDAAEALSAEFTERLERLIARIFDPAEPFRQTDNLRSCEHCDFRQLCRR